jgi:hypothetical protein
VFLVREAAAVRPAVVGAGAAAGAILAGEGDGAILVDALDERKAENARRVAEKGQNADECSVQAGTRLLEPSPWLHGWSHNKGRLAPRQEMLAARRTTVKSLARGPAIPASCRRFRWLR